jgi:hypothetical protein
MARNRKNESVVLRFGPALKAFGLCVILGGAAVGYVWQKSQIDQLGRQIREREIKLIEVREQNKKLRDHLAILRSPGRLEQKLAELKLGLGLPAPGDVWRVSEPVAPPGEFPAVPAQPARLAGP